MDFHYKYRQSNAYQLRLEGFGHYLSPFKKYSALILFGACVSWCEEGNGKLDYKPVAILEDTFTYMVLTNLDCWDILQMLEAEHVHFDDALELCYEIKNGNESPNSLDLDDLEDERNRFNPTLVEKVGGAEKVPDVQENGT